MLQQRLRIPEPQIQDRAPGPAAVRKRQPHALDPVRGQDLVILGPHSRDPALKQERALGRDLLRRWRSRAPSLIPVLILTRQRTLGQRVPAPVLELNLAQRLPGQRAPAPAPVLGLSLAQRILGQRTPVPASNPSRVQRTQSLVFREPPVKRGQPRVLREPVQALRRKPARALQRHVARTALALRPDLQLPKGNLALCHRQEPVPLTQVLPASLARAQKRGEQRALRRVPAQRAGQLILALREPEPAPGLKAPQVKLDQAQYQTRYCVLDLVLNPKGLQFALRLLERDRIPRQ